MSDVPRELYDEVLAERDEARRVACEMFRQSREVIWSVDTNEYILKYPWEGWRRECPWLREDEA